ncbi:MAG: ATP-NAD kinase family protein [Lutisporaceae bacterium]|jgi:predicted polyphosphate/ATP-dependent NAD kinase
MISIGIIANPASGKDIRRIVSHATVIDNYEKVNIVERIILGAQGCGVDEVYIMADTFQIGNRVIDNLIASKELKANIKLIDIKLNGNVSDTINTAKIMEDMKIGCIVVLGGDGTNRAIAKSIDKTPLISISTGTNNVYPDMMEGTAAGMAAAVVAANKFDICHTYLRDKRIEVFRNGIFTDIALIDAVICKDLYVGSKAIWNVEDIIKVIVSRAHPASIGFSSLIGCMMTIKESDDYGASVDLNCLGKTVIVPIAAGIMKKVNTCNLTRLNLNEEYYYKAAGRGIIAVDGEREVPFKEGDEFIFKITRNGPYHVDVKKTLEIAQENGFFIISGEEVY